MCVYTAGSLEFLVVGECTTQRPAQKRSIPADRLRFNICPIVCNWFCVAREFHVLVKNQEDDWKL